MTACGTREPEVSNNIVYPDLPPLDCKDNPPVPVADADDNAAAIYIRGRFDAGDDCRKVLASVRQAASTWPKTKPAETQHKSGSVADWLRKNL